MHNEYISKRILAGAGINIPRSITAPTIADLDPGAAGLTPPYALKGLGFAHKSEAGAVRLGLDGLLKEAESE